MINRTWAPNALQVSVDDTYGKAVISVSAQLTADKSQLVVRVANTYMSNATININVAGLSVGSDVTVWSLSSVDTDVDNTPAQPTAISPVQTTITWSTGTPLNVAGNAFAVFVMPVV